ncbi:MAG: dTMP kinase [Rhodospirillales bacterium]
MAAARGRFISLEGGEGTGKSTQAALLADALRRQGLTVVLTREPGGSPGGEAIRGFIKGALDLDWAPATEALLHAAARLDHLQRVIRPALAAGAWVVSDRFADSTRAYQGYGQGLDLAWLARLEDLVVAADWPDLTLVFDLPAEIAARRLAGRRLADPDAARADRYERMDEAFHGRVHDAFATIAQSDPARCLVVDAGGSPEAVHARVLAVVRERFGVPLAPGG